MSLVIIIALLGLLASVSPSTIVVFILLLATARARVNAAAFLVGWSVSLVIVFAVSYAVGAAHIVQLGNGSTAVEVIEIVLGVALGVCGRPAMEAPGSAQNWLRGHQEVHRPPEGAPSMGSSDRRGPRAAVDAYRRRRRGSGASPFGVPHCRVCLFLAFALLSTATVGLIFLYFARRPGEAEAHLSDLRDRLVRAGPATFAIVSLVVGVCLIIDGVTGIVGG